MKTYARVQDSLVAELLKTDGDIASMFNPALVWVDASSRPDIAEGWGWDGTHFTPPRPTPVTPPVPTVIELEAQLAAISAQLAALSSAKS